MGQIEIIIGNGALGRRLPQGDSISALVANGVASGGVALGSVYKLGRLQDAIDLGIDAAYDTTNDIPVYEHIKEFFRACKNGTLYFMLVAQTVTYNDLLDPAVATSAIKVIRAAQGEVKQLGIAYNPSVTVTTDAAVLAAIAKAQLLVDACREESMPISVVLEGKGFLTTSITTLRNKLAPGVSVMVGQNPEVVDQFDATCAAVGTALGTIALSKVNECIGWVGKYNLVGDNLEAGMVGGIALGSVSQTILDDLDSEGYLYFKSFVNYTGLYMNDSHTADAVTSDYCYIENNRTIDKASRLIRQALMPYVNSPVLIDSSTGQIDPATIASMEAIGNRAILPMFQANEISGPDPNGPTPPFQIDPAQNILSGDPLATELTVVPTGTARQIKVQINFANPNSN